MKCHQFVFVLCCQALMNGFLDFSNFNVLEYEHYEVDFVFNNVAVECVLCSVLCHILFIMVRDGS